MTRLVCLVIGGAALAASGAASAQDVLPEGVYLRGSLGASFAQGPNLRDNNYAADGIIDGNAAGTVPGRLNHLGAGVFVGVGAGYEIVPSVRLEGTFSYGGGYHLGGNDQHAPNSLLNDPGGLTYVSGTARVYGVMLGVAYDVPLPLGPVKPFVSGGIGLAVVDAGQVNMTYLGAPTSFAGATRVNFAYRVGGGLGLALDKNWTLELAYQYVDNGDLVYPSQTFRGAGVAQSSSGWKGSLVTQDVTVGLRVHF